MPFNNFAHQTKKKSTSLHTVKYFVKAMFFFSLIFFQNLKGEIDDLKNDIQYERSYNVQVENQMRRKTIEFNSLNLKLETALGQERDVRKKFDLELSKQNELHNKLSFCNEILCELENEKQVLEKVI